MDVPSLFDQPREPLAARLRPRSLDDFVGQEHIVGPGRLLRRAIAADQLSSLIFAGPPGTGKTTLARVIAERTKSQFLSLNAVLSGVKEVREAIAQAREFWQRIGRKTILFVDEVHRWNKSQQDALLPWVENGTIVLIGATTENPFFEVNRALLSRSRVFLLKQLQDDDLEAVLDRALRDTQHGYGTVRVRMDEQARAHLIRSAAGDARTLLNALELAVETSVPTFPPPPEEEIHVTLATAEDSIQQRAVLYDKDGDHHFDTISAFIKSVRGSDPDAALYWLARMVHAGEDPRFILRRLLILACEDVGLADPYALGVVTACAQAFDRVGMPEGQYHLAHATLYLCNTPKSNSTLGYFDALKEVERLGTAEVPGHLQDPSRDGPQLGHGKDYRYPHAYREHWVAQQYLPTQLQGAHFYRPGELGWEGTIAETLRNRRELQFAAGAEAAEEVLTARGRHIDAETHFQRRARADAAGAVVAVRDRIVELLQTLSHHRVLVLDSAPQLVVPTLIPQCREGELVVVTANKEAAQWVAELGASLTEVEQPRVVTSDPAEYLQAISLNSGNEEPPFERISLRTSAAMIAALREPSRREQILTGLSHSARAEARLVCFGPDWSAPSGLSALAAHHGHNQLSQLLHDAERAATRELTPAAVSFPPVERWTLIADEVLKVEERRLLTTAEIDAWLAPGASLSAYLSEDALEESRRILHTIVESSVGSALSWTRAYRILLATPVTPPG